MSTHFLDLRNVEKTIVPCLPKLQGTSPDGVHLDFTNYYLQRNGQPFFAIAGEFHYSRYDWRDWETELIKIRAGGVNVVPTYIFWIHHEEEEGCFDWQGNRDLRRFVQLCGKHGLYVILRMGPFDHGECRNGGMPDWLHGRPFELRSNDEGYLHHVRRLYGEIGRQVQGLMFQDGGPVIGVQLENEYGHCGAPWEMTRGQGDEWVPSGRDGEEHLRALKDIAISSGLNAPMFTSTGWGGAAVLEEEVLPLYGGYAFCPWSVNDRNTVHPATEEFLFRDFHNNALRYSNFDPPYDPERYPFACCEMGAGMQVWYSYRFQVPPNSAEAMALMKVAGGCNYIGYYVYHGGSNPIGKHAYLNENTTPKISYDFQAPIGEFGQMRESYRYLKPLHQFLQDFAGLLCPMATVLPQGALAIQPQDTGTLRYAARAKGGSGFLFINNYQDHVDMRDHEDVRFNVALPEGEFTIPHRGGLTIRRDMCAVLPLGLDLDGVRLQYATAQLITRLQHEGQAYWFFFAPEGIRPEYCLRNGSFRVIDSGVHRAQTDAGCSYVCAQPGTEGALTLTTLDGRKVHIVTLTRRQALQMSKVDLWGAARIALCDGHAYERDGALCVGSLGSPTVQLSLFPDAPSLCAPGAVIRKVSSGLFATYEVRMDAAPARVQVERIGEGRAVIRLEGAQTWDGELILSIPYVGDVGRAYIDGRLISDNFCNGTPWEIGLKRHRDEILAKGLYLYITPRKTGKAVVGASAMAAQQWYEGEAVCQIGEIELVPVYEAQVTAEL